MVFRLPDDEIVFPNPELAEADGLLAIGGDLSPERLLLAYENGIFPWFSDDDPILWFSPHERCVIFPDKVKISKSMQKVLQSDEFTITENQAFAEVISHCAKIKREGQDGTWITNEMQQAYIKMHRLGFAKSVEVWQNGKLVGGLYGISICEVFCGESMFSSVSNASKVALISLCKSNNYQLVDCQMPNDHLLSMGAEMISRKDYMNFLKV